MAFFSGLFSGPFVPVGPFACPNSEGKISTFALVALVNIRPCFTFRSEKNNVIVVASSNKIFFLYSMQKFTITN